MAEGPRILALGPMGEIEGLQSIGVEPVPVQSAAELAQALRDQTRDGSVALVLVSETLAGEAEELIAGMRRPGGPIILPIPSHRGAEGLALQWMKHAMEQSIGVDMISKHGS